MEEKNKNLIAVYGSLRHGFGNHRLIEDSTLLGTIQSEPIYSLYDLGYYPGLKKDGDTKVTLEIYEVDDITATRVDSLEGYTPGKEATFYDKEFIDTPWGNAGIYIYVPSIAGRTLVESGDWAEYFANK